MTVLMPASLAAVRHLRMQGGSLGEKMGSFTGVTILLSRQRDFIACRAAGSLTWEILVQKRLFLGQVSILEDARNRCFRQGNIIACKAIVGSSFSPPICLLIMARTGVSSQWWTKDRRRLEGPHGLLLLSEYPG